MKNLAVVIPQGFFLFLHDINGTSNGGVVVITFGARRDDFSSVK